MSVIIPTLGLPERVHLLEAAIASVTRQVEVYAVPLVVLNGRRASPDLEPRLRDDARVRLVRLEEADLPAALHAGRVAVETPFFAALDDDDALLPGALARRVGEFGDSGIEVVVTNGFVRDESGAEELNVPPGVDINADPLRALLRRNWLLPGSWLCRSERVGPDLFEDMPRFLECTYLAARFATAYRMQWLDEPTVVYRLGSPLAESRSRGYVVGQADALRRILRLSLPRDVRHTLRRRVASAYHRAASYDHSMGDYRRAWRWHLASLRWPGGWRFLPFTRHLIRPPGERAP